MKRLFIKKSRATAVTGYLDHLIANGLFTTAVVIVLLLEQNNYLLEVLTGMIYSTLLCSPDMDSSRAVVYRNWLLLKYLWWPYTAWFKHEGNDWNFVFNTKRGIGHNVLLGTAFRILYTSLLLWLAGQVTGCWWEIRYWILDNKIEAGHIILGVWLADAGHILVDALVHRN